MTKRKARYWEIIAYPSSLPNDWKEIINDWRLPVAVSPLHNKDKYETTTEEHQEGEIKKEHYHIILVFGNTTSYSCVLDYAKELGTQAIRQISSLRGAYDYLTHKNNPEKAQYEEEKIQYFGGFNKEDTITYNESEIEELKRNIINIINQQNIVEYKVLYDYFNKVDLRECCSIISRNTQFFNAYLKSKKFIDVKD